MEHVEALARRAARGRAGRGSRARARARRRPAGRRRPRSRPRRPSRSRRAAPAAAGRVDRRPAVLDAEVEHAPRLDPVAHLDEREPGEARREARDEPLERRAPGAGHLLALAAVHADDGALGARVRQPQLGAAGSSVHRVASTARARLRLVRVRGVAGAEVRERHRDRVVLHLPDVAELVADEVVVPGRGGSRRRIVPQAA